MPAAAHPYSDQRIGLATLHAKDRAIAPPFRRLLGAEVVVAPGVDTDLLGTFSGEIPRPYPLVEVCVSKAELVFDALDVDCAVANEGSYGPIDRVPLAPGGVEIMAFIDKRRGVRLVETLATHRTNWRLWHFRAGERGVGAALKAIGFPEYGVFVICNSDRGRPVKGLATVEEVEVAIDREARRSEDGLALLIADMRAHRNRLRMQVVRALATRLVRRLGRLCPRCRAPGFGHVDSRRGLPCEACGAPTHLVDFEIDGCTACGHATVRARSDGRQTAPATSCGRCREAAPSPSGGSG